MINKFLFPKGGSETYMLRLGEYLTSRGHEVQYFGMDDPTRIVGNSAGAYTAPMDFHGGSVLSRLTYPLRTVYSAQARKKLRLVLEDMQPDVCHLNNFNYQLTPSVILEIDRWSKKSGHPCRIIYTAHDYQLVCPNHMCYNTSSGRVCEKCLDGCYSNCVRDRCIHNSAARSVIGFIEAVFWRHMGVYSRLDSIICCSDFLRTKLNKNPILAEKTVTMHNFVDTAQPIATTKKDYVLYFGRYSKEKGIQTFIEAAKHLPEIRFVCAGAGELESLCEGVANVENVGYQSGEALVRLISEARITICPSECYENCPYSVMESLVYGTPVLGANIGGIPELIQSGKTGELFESGNPCALAEKLMLMWQSERESCTYSKNCGSAAGMTRITEYYDRLMKLYCAGAMQ